MALLLQCPNGAPEAQEEQKAPKFCSCALAENHAVFPSAFQLLCRSPAQTTGLKRERVSSKTLLLLLHSTWLFLRCSRKPHSRSSPPGGQETISQGSCSIVLLQSPSENIKKPHTPSHFYLPSVMIFFFFLNGYVNTNRKCKTLSLHLQSRF